ncbi:MAG TPA: hypothetical protein DIT10_14195 [Chryseobacterium sp.]|nr:hypothetical protein [Chryseobacterium sp.]
MSRLKKTFAPRATRSEAQTNDHKEDETKYEPISNQDAKISLAKTEVTQITYAPFRNRAFSKIEKGVSRIQFPDSGLHVLALNKALNALRHKVPENEMSFGEKTRVALINFQKKNGITGSGIFDKETLLKMDELTQSLDEGETTRKAPSSGKKSESEKSNKNTSESASLSDSKMESQEVFQSSLKTDKDPIKLKKCNPDHADDYCLVVSFIPATNIPKGNTIEGYAIYYQTVYGGSEENAIKVAELWGENGRINFSGEIPAGTQTTVNVPLEKYLDNLFFGAPKNAPAREALKQKLLGIIRTSIGKNEKEIDRKELNTFLTDEYSKITEDSEYITLKNKLKSLKAPELSPEGKKAAKLLEKDPENSEAQDLLIEEFERFGKEMVLYMLQINRKLILTEAERHGVWLPYGEHKNKLQELKTDIEVYKTQMATIQANLPSLKEQQKLYKEAYNAISIDPNATDIHDQKVNQASGIEKKYDARNEIYKSSPILSIGDDFSKKGLKADKQNWAPDWESFDVKTDEQIIAVLKNSIIKQLEKIDEAEENINDEDLDFIWDFGKIIPISLQQAGISNNKNAVKVIQDKVRREAKYELIKNIILIAGGIILSIVTLGQATPFLLAVLAGGGALAISTYYVKKDIHEYKLNQSLYDASLQFGQVLQDDDPTMIMIGLSLLGMFGDTAQVIRILKAARATNTVYRSILSLSKAEGLSSKEMAVLDEMIAESDKIGKLYSADELKQLASTADRLGMTSTELVHHVYIGGRFEKPLTATELMEQMKNWKRIIKPRGYTFKFTDKKEFQEFSETFIKGLKNVDIPIYDVRVQGSALRTPNAKDVDLVTMLTKEDFADALIKAFNGKVKTKDTGEIVELSGKSFEELEKMAKNILENKTSYNSVANTFQNAMLSGKISSKSASTSKTSFLKEFREVRVKLAEKYPHLNIEDITLQPMGGNFDLQPYFKLSEHEIKAFDMMDLLPLLKSGKFVEPINKEYGK